jgi:hypothetical protein
MVPTATATCTVPQRHPEKGNASAADNYLVANMYNGGMPYFDKIADLQIELLAQILICGLTRFATLVLPNTAGPGLTPKQVASLDGSGMEEGAVGTDRPVPDDFHNSIAHNSGSSSLVVQQAVSTVSRYYYGKVARLMQRLQEAGLLDSTLILVGNEGGDGSAHDTLQVPLVLAGGANGGIKMGRRVVSPGRTAKVGQRCTGVSSTSHNPILVAVANAFGANLTHFGTCSNTQMTAGVTGLI